MASRIFGSGIKRREDPRLITGQAKYTDDLVLPGMLHAAFLGSPVPHGRIIRVDTSRAATVPGVHAILTGRDVTGRRFGRRLLERPILAWDRTLFVGDRIAVVAAETREAAQASVALIDVEIEELDPVLDVEDALMVDAQVLHPDAGGYRYLGAARHPAVHRPRARVVVQRAGGPF